MAHSFEGSVILERLALVDRVEDFFEAIDNDDFEYARELMELAGVADGDIEVAIAMMKDSDSDH